MVAHLLRVPPGRFLRQEAPKLGTKLPPNSGLVEHVDQEVSRRRCGGPARTLPPRTLRPAHDAADEPAEQFDYVGAVNLPGVWACMSHELRQMRAQGSGASFVVGVALPDEGYTAR